MVDDPTSDDLLLDLDETHAAVLRATQSDQQENGLRSYNNSRTIEVSPEKDYFR